MRGLELHRVLELRRGHLGEVHDRRERVERGERRDGLGRGRAHVREERLEELGHLALEELERARLDRVVRADEVGLRLHAAVVGHARQLGALRELDRLDGGRADVDAQVRAPRRARKEPDGAEHATSIPDRGGVRDGILGP